MRYSFNVNYSQLLHNGSLADYYETGGREEDIAKWLRQEGKALTGLDFNQHARVTFEWPRVANPEKLYLISVWVLRIDKTGTDEDFRFCYSSEGIQEQRILRGLNP